MSACRKNTRKENRASRWYLPPPTTPHLNSRTGAFPLYDKEKGTDNNAVKYTDYALGQLMKKARESDWKDTIFLVVADHDIRVKGESTIPIRHFHIPGLILGADIKPRRIKTVASRVRPAHHPAFIAWH